MVREDLDMIAQPTHEHDALVDAASVDIEGSPINLSMRECSSG